MKFGMIRKVAAYAEEKAAAAGKRVRFGTMTNGLPLTEEVIEFIADKRVETTVSFDGPREVQDANRPLKNGAPSYDIIAPRLRALTKRYPYADDARDALAGNRHRRRARCRAPARLPEMPKSGRC